ncbi:inorganic phosphate transporter [Methanoculleus sp. FWC-SCC1]|uniref:Inorganic phosphate transporter n=1 Tax=Methanoculleus frigidifontis TaxID=2584085 RepID=A0ABT8M9E7_9EURY|nr:inorganic phosphate transporter [Methanoculleus sp. FWC-SCC1]MDN7024567.1 inorganic phosphate transporter [Methanoculleus sp. FWC-SCC1]
MLLVAAVAIVIAFFFTFTNGFQDASAIAATFIASRSATPRQGIIMVAAMALLGAIFGGSAVAFTLIGLISIESDVETLFVLVTALVAATAWNLVAWRYRLPSSSTHALIGGLVGAGIAAAGPGSVNWGVGDLLAPPHELNGLALILVFLVVSVLAGFFGSFVLQKASALLLRNARRGINRSIIRFNWVAAAMMSFFNGANDTQKQLGVIALVLVAAGESATIETPFWARAVLALLIAAGTLSGGWRIMTTLGRRIFEVEPIHSFDSQVSSGAAIALSTVAGAPISSTHIISTSVIGVGAAENPRKVRWSVGREIVIAMVMTIPVTMVIAGALYFIISPFTGV